MLMNVYELQIKTKFERCDPGNAEVRVWMLVHNAQPVELVSGQMGVGHYMGVEPYIYDVDTWKSHIWTVNFKQSLKRVLGIQKVRVSESCSGLVL